MRFGLSVLILMAALGGVCFAQSTADTQQSSSNDQKQTAAQSEPNAEQGGDANTAAQPADSGQKGTDSGDEKPGAMKRLKHHLRDQVSSGCVNAVGQHCWDKPAKDETNDKSDEQQPEKTKPPRSDAGRDDNLAPGESSSKNTKIDLGPPAGEAPAPGVGVDESDVHEMKPWDPHKADKNVEVGDFYFKRGNYAAAESRYSEALYWQDNHAIAMFRLGQVEEKLGRFTEARNHYKAYLKILPEGEFALQSQQGIDRLKDKPDQPVRSSATVPVMK